MTKMAMEFVLDRVEDIMGKGENAGYQCLFFPQCFQKIAFHPGVQIPGSFGKDLTFSQTSPGFYVSAVKVF